MASWFVLRLEGTEQPEPQPEVGGGRILAAPIGRRIRQEVEAEVALREWFEQAITAHVELLPKIFFQAVEASVPFEREFQVMLSGERAPSPRYRQALEDDDLLLLLS